LSPAGFPLAGDCAFGGADLSATARRNTGALLQMKSNQSPEPIESSFETTATDLEG